MRFNPFKLADNLIERDYKIPVLDDSVVGYDSNESFMTCDSSRFVNLAEYLNFLRSYILKLQEIEKKCRDYEIVLSKYKDTTPRSVYREGCRDTFGAGFISEYDEYKEIRDVYWKWNKNES